MRALSAHRRWRSGIEPTRALRAAEVGRKKRRRLCGRRRTEACKLSELDFLAEELRGAQRSRGARVTEVASPDTGRDLVHLAVLVLVDAARRAGQPELERRAVDAVHRVVERARGSLETGLAGGLVGARRA